MTVIHTAIICLGSNVNPRRARIDRALKAVGAFCDIEAISEITESDDVTARSLPYMNMVAECRTCLTCDQFRARISEIERNGGRRADSRATGVVEIDIDLVIWDGEIISPDDFAQAYFTSNYKRLKIKAI